jgi:hypothetical protein
VWSHRIANRQAQAPPARGSAKSALKSAQFARTFYAAQQGVVGHTCSHSMVAKEEEALMAQLERLKKLEPQRAPVSKRADSAAGGVR